MLMNKLLRQNQHGIATVLLVVIVVVLAGAGFAGYRVLNNKDGSGGGSSLSKEEAKKVLDDCNDAINDKDFCKFTTNFSGLEKYSAVISSKTSDGDSSIEIKADGDNSQTTITTEGTVFADYISLDGKNYTKDIASGEWTVTEDNPSDLGDLKDDINIDYQTDLPEAERTQYKSLGKEACGNLTCFKYQIIDPKEATGDQFIFFDDDDYLLRKWSFTSEEAGTSEATFSYDNIKISKPSPIKE